MEQSTFNIEFPVEEEPSKDKKIRRSKKSREKTVKVETEKEIPEVEERTQVRKEPHIFTVSEITTEIRSILEERYPDIWLTGEVSNLRDLSARNYYFVLKDETSQMRAVVFGGRQRLSFDLQDGLEVICHGKISVYNARGDYQIIIDYCEPKGVGALQIAFEQLKKKLDAEGLFAKERKRKIPYLPRKIGVITSPTGAAIRDIINILTRRFPTIEILLIPVKVQGEGAAAEIADAISLMNKQQDVDVMIVGRGGGSLEDLWAFNEEVVARAIFASRIPVISAVGHQIDFTISDFVADLRAPTPSAAAEMAVPEMKQLFSSVEDLKRELMLALKQELQSRWTDVQRLKGQLLDPTKRFPDLHMRLDGLAERLKYSVETKISQGSQSVIKLESNLKHLSPMHILEKGYAVVTAKGSSVKSSASIKKGSQVDIRFHKGSAQADVTKIVD